jgi:hypothetical protein
MFGAMNKVVYFVNSILVLELAIYQVQDSHCKNALLFSVAYFALLIVNAILFVTFGVLKKPIAEGFNFSILGFLLMYLPLVIIISMF